ncbi:hypothetical protein PILCRDRAFT_804839 [Piloderma croceum F 1598]|uniref:Uncharacterized protein n=1 Tax=Piloderma croceum (strain F 1598) TaxID=765440 RepID=A0A0C3AD07_PILCF|nr:hypothetical protein PILCRDRAFT_804839 [Piloderma croceum F 1598]
MSVDVGEQDDIQMGLNKDNVFDFPEASPLLLPPFKFFDMDLPPSSPAPPELAIKPSKYVDIALPDMVADHASDKKNGGSLEKSVLEMISPYPNVSTFQFGNWFWNGSYKKSKEEWDKLIDTMLAPDFDVEDL